MPHATNSIRSDFAAKPTWAIELSRSSAWPRRRKGSLPFLGGQLRPVQQRDLDGIAWLLRAASVRRYLCDGRFVSDEDVARMLALSDRLDHFGLGLWTIKTEGEGLIGLFGLEPTSRRLRTTPSSEREAQVMIAIDPRFTRRGLATKSLAAIALHARKTLGLSTIVAVVDQPNLPSQRLLERFGFQECERAPGPFHEVILYRLRLEREQLSPSLRLVRSAGEAVPGPSPV